MHLEIGLADNYQYRGKMKIKVDEKDVFELTEVQKQVIKNDIHEDLFEEDMKRRLHYILTHKYEQCFKRLKEEWEPKLKKSGLKQLPVDDEEYAKLIFSQPGYQSRKQREKSTS